MPRVSGPQRLANRQAVLAAWAAAPHAGASAIGRAAGGVHEASVRSIIKTYGEAYLASLANVAPAAGSQAPPVAPAPPDAPRRGRPTTRGKRWLRCVHRRVALTCLPSFLPQHPREVPPPGPLPEFPGLGPTDVRARPVPATAGTACCRPKEIVLQNYPAVCLTHPSTPSHNPIPSHQIPQGHGSQEPARSKGTPADGEAQETPEGVLQARRISCLEAGTPPPN
jgi:hypothetical protein